MSTNNFLTSQVETEYPIISPKVRFKIRRVCDVRDGYVEILPIAGKPIVNVFKHRIDTAIQAAHPVQSNQAQTICTYPLNAYTQYYYECKFIDDPGEKVRSNIVRYLNENLNTIHELLEVNGYINLYLNDYEDLLVDDMSIGTIPIPLDFKEYMSFTDIVLCKEKRIASVSWHPMWSGTVAISYTDIAPNQYTSMPPAGKDTVERAIHGVNPVLLWSLLDPLNAKLIMEAHREVTTVSFCPYDENILVGGCINGQVIVWDIRNKLKNVEEEEILTDEQQKYRALMYSLIGWMKNIKDPKFVAATAVSNMEHSHENRIMNIVWLPPYWKINKQGHLKELSDDSKESSIMFVTSSRDGSIMFWDLTTKPDYKGGQFRVQRKLKRLKKRPSALTVDASPWRILHRVLKPEYKIEVRLSNENDRILPLNFLYMRTPSYKYVDVNPERNKKPKLTERIIHKLILEKPQDAIPKHEFLAGSTEGDFFTATWEGFTYSTGDIINVEPCKFLNFSKYHDGPIVCISRSTSENILLTVGGKVFAIWKDGYNNKPIMWRKSRHRYTFGGFSQYKAGYIRLTRSDGGLETWNILHQTDSLISEQILSGKAILNTCASPYQSIQNIMGISDENGSFRLFLVPPAFLQTNEGEIIKLHSFFAREMTRKTEFAIWQEEWYKKNASTILKRQQKQKTTQEEQKIEEHQSIGKKETKKPERPPPGKFSEWAAEQWNRKEEERLSKLLLAKKQLNRELLEEQHIPIKQYEEEKQKKKQRQEECLANSEKTFTETVAMLFPDIVKEKPPPPPDPYAGGEPKSEKERQYAEYQQMQDEMKMFVEDHPFMYVFDFKAVLQAGKLRRSMLETQMPKPTHKKRHEMYKLQREQLEEEELKNVKQIAIQRNESLGKASLDSDAIVFDYNEEEEVIENNP